jgi:hypothetical protein
VGKCNARTIAQAVETGDAAQARKEAEEMAAIWAAVAGATTEDARQLLIARYGARLVKSFNTYATRMRRLGLEGPYA